ncbi:hypothetical protein OS125_11300 [Corynebacterium sp. P7003]|uniref:Uncharacterized protein n=1 Tax=Corynebacterium pygosceleis TaxID=2800406 RepID=A0ABT3WYA8_9CORY|nr:hypothetical protein [Corynebacterium pygosceleis]MCX7445818.1 hypothetical protein [Corynebacterium pygosceleis]
MTIRRMLVLVNQLSRDTSRFWCDLYDREPLTNDGRVTASIYTALVDVPHPLLGSRSELIEAGAREQEKKKEAEARRERVKRAFAARRSALNNN